MSTGTGVNVSKANTYAVLEKPAGVNVSKANTYAVLEKPAGVNVSKACVYVVLVPVASNPPVWPVFDFGSGTVNVAYEQKFDLTPAAAPITYTLQSGTLPPGTALTSDGTTVGQITGTPTAAGTYNFTIKATNIYGSAISQQLTIVIAPPPYGVPVPQGELPNGVTGAAYAAGVGVQGGTGPFTFAVAAGSLPTGLALNSVSGAVTGKPTTAQVSNFTISVTGFGGNTGSKDYSVTISEPVGPAFPTFGSSLENYTSLITSQHNQRPNYMGVISILAQPGVDKQNVMATLPSLLDLDFAVGDQLDKLGEWIGASRNLKQPLPPTGITTLQDNDYRLLLQAIVALNNWDGTVPGMYDIWSIVFSGSTFEVLIQDNQDMSMFVVILASTFSTVALALLTNGYFDLRPAGVRMKGYYQPSVPGQPVFGWGVNNDKVAGWGTGVWIQPIVVE